MRIFVIRKRSLYIAGGLIVAIIISLFLFWGMSRDSAVSNYSLKYNYRNLLPEEAKSLLDNNPNVIVLDVRSPKDYAKGHLSNALVIPYKELKGRIEELDANDTYLVYCDNGKYSARASKTLAESGYPRIFTLVGGYKKWPYEIEKSLH